MLKSHHHLKIIKSFPFISIGLFTIIGIYGINLGLGEDPDSEQIHLISESVVNGDIVASRYFGSPFYEIPASYLIQIFSISTANIFTLITSLISLCVVYFLIRNSMNYHLIFPTIVLSPLFLINNSIIMETSQGILFFLFTILFTKKYIKSEKYKYLIAAFIFVYCAIMTRPDYVILGCGIFLVIFLNKMQNKRELFKLYILLLVGILACYHSYQSIYSEIDIFSVSTGGDSLFRKMLRAIAGIMNLFTPIGVLIIILLTVTKFKSVLAFAKNFYNLDYLHQLTIVMTPLYLIRFFLLPDELEYIFPLYLLILISFSHVHINKKYLTILSISIISVNLIHISFFERHALSDELVVSININQGAIIQDFAARKFKQINRTASFQDHLLKVLKYNCIECKAKSIHYKIFGPGYITDTNYMITDRYNAHIIDNSRFLDQYSGYGKVFVCEDPVRTHRGWRLMQPSKPYNQTISKYRKNLMLVCNDNTN